MIDFKRIENKLEWRFIQVDIKNYYSSINETLFNSALILAKNKLARNKLGMTREEIEIVKLPKTSFLRYKGKLWIRKDTRDGYEITIGGSDSEEASDLVGLYLLSKLIKWIPIIKGSLYRDDGLFLI